jgi:hypothetical protein
MPDNDLVVRCFARGATAGEGHKPQFFSVHYLSTDELLAGPFSTMQVAIDVARSCAAQEGVSVWLELSPGSNNLERLV